jgi:hypothetical protein
VAFWLQHTLCCCPCNGDLIWAAAMLIG